MKTSRKSQIVNLAGRLFAKGGYNKVTTKTIAEKCNITEAALYKHFKSKEEIYLEVLKTIQTKVSADSFLDTLKDESNIEKLLSSMAKFISASYLKHNQMLRLLLYSSLEEHAMARKLFHSTRMPYIDFLTDKLKQLIKAGKIVKINPQITARCFVGMVFDCALNAKLWKGMAGRVYNTETIINNNIPLFARGLTKAS